MRLPLGPGYGTVVDQSSESSYTLDTDNACCPKWLAMIRERALMTQEMSDTCPAASDEPMASGCPVSAGGYDGPPIPLGPDSLTWKYFGQWTGLFQGTWAGSMQNMHPQLGAAVKDHSIFFMERIPRLMRSIYPIGGVVFDGYRPADRRRGPRLSHRTQRCRRTGASVQRIEP